MYYSALKRNIQALEEKLFYDIAILFLECLGYKELSIVDGSGDGGRDVICSRSELRIQLSVRKDWESKINDEANITFAAGKRHFIYITNRQIREQERVSFINNNYVQKGEVDLSIYDLNRISTTLVMPGVVRKTYEKLGMVVDQKISATPQQLAISNLLLFSNEAKDLRQSVIESNIKAQIYKIKDIKSEDVIKIVSSNLPGVDIEHNVKTAFDSLCSKKEVIAMNGKLALNNKESEIFEAAEEEYLQSIKQDSENLMLKYGLQEVDAHQLIEMALEIIAEKAN